MRTAIFVYQPTQIDIQTCESDLELCGLSIATQAVSHGKSSTTLAAGMYRIDSCHDVAVAVHGGNSEAIEVVVAPNKTNSPTLPTVRASEAFASLDNQAMTAFFAVPDAKAALNP